MKRTYTGVKKVIQAVAAIVTERSEAGNESVAFLLVHFADERTVSAKTFEVL
jgi:hypothetical protein